MTKLTIECLIMIKGFYLNKYVTITIYNINNKHYRIRKTNQVNKREVIQIL